MSPTKLKLSSQQLQALNSGDESVFKLLFLNYQPRLYRFFWLKIRSVELAEDLVQETFLRIWKTKNRIKNDDNLDIYIFRIASNLSIDVFRKKQRTKEFVPIDYDQLLDNDQTEDLAQANQLSQFIDKILTKLPENPRTSFLLSRNEGFSHVQIAEIMNISVKTVEKHIGKALNILRKELRKLGFLTAVG